MSVDAHIEPLAFDAPRLVWLQRCGLWVYAVGGLFCIAAGLLALVAWLTVLGICGLGVFVYLRARVRAANRHPYVVADRTGIHMFGQPSCDWADVGGARQPVWTIGERFVVRDPVGWIETVQLGAVVDHRGRLLMSFRQHRKASPQIAQVLSHLIDDPSARPTVDAERRPPITFREMLRDDKVG